MSINVRYCFLQIAYWLNACLAMGFGISYLTDFGFEAGMIGFLFALFTLAAALLQPMLGRIADRSSFFHWKRLLIILAILSEIMAILLLLTENPIASAILFGLFMTFISSQMSMINVASFYYVHRGERINYGVARGLGSLAFAALSAVMGQLVETVGIKVVPGAGVITAGLTILLAFSFPYYEKNKAVAPTSNGPGEAFGRNGKAAGAGEKTPTKKRAGLLTLFRKYPAFFLMVLACIFFMTYQNMCSNYMLLILETVGGDNSNLGVVLALAAVLEIPVMFGAAALLKRFRSQLLITVAGFLFVLRGICYCLAGSVVSIYLIQLFQPITYAMIVCISVYFTDECVEEEDLATGQSFMAMTLSIGGTLGFLLGGQLIERLGIKAMLLGGLLVVSLGAVLSLLSALMIRRKSS